VDEDGDDEPPDQPAGRRPPSTDHTISEDDDFGPVNGGRTLHVNTNAAAAAAARDVWPAVAGVAVGGRRGENNRAASRRRGVQVHVNGESGHAPHRERSWEETGA